MKEHDRARKWREHHGWSREQLEGLLGYARETIYWMEQGLTSDRKPINEWVWKRYKLACAGLEAQQRGKEFNW